MHSIFSVLMSFYLLFSHHVLQNTPHVCIIGKTPLHIGVQIKQDRCVWEESGALPDISCTPGAIDSRVTQENIHETICVSGYTKTVRPPTSVTNPMKHKQLQAYGQPDVLSDYELDHQISLELGGCPDCVSNLWPEPYNGLLGAYEKDAVENYLHEQVCSDEMTLKEAQEAIACDWTEVYAKMSL